MQRHTHARDVRAEERERKRGIDGSSLVQQQEHRQKQDQGIGSAGSSSLTGSALPCSPILIANLAPNSISVLSLTLLLLHGTRCKRMAEQKRRTKTMEDGGRERERVRRPPLLALAPAYAHASWGKESERTRQELHGN